MQTWVLYIFLLVIVILFFGRKQRMDQLEQRLIKNERIVRLIANRLGIDQDIVMELDTDLFELPQQNKTIKPLKQANEREEDLHELLQNKKRERINRQKVIDLELLELLQHGKKIEAIKRARQRYDFGLKEAKDHVEHLERKFL
ncbi:hypothetical protein [Shimazuella kribbensis]|uniref:hypothetical protein n=1 Tax=Shimazuella kribbensis TaxID=139808 RepID=UPI0003FC0BF0|nr:hypothetical protein [Shimazuella kribbensis]